MPFHTQVNLYPIPTRTQTGLKRTELGVHTERSYQSDVDYATPGLESPLWEPSVNITGYNHPDWHRYGVSHVD